MKWYEKPKEFMTNKRFMQELMNISKVVLAIIVFVITFGIIDGFTPEAILQAKSAIRLIGFFLTLDILTNAFTERAEFDARESEEDIQKVEKEGIEQTHLVDDSLAIQWISDFNREDRENEVQKKRERIKNKLTDKLSRWQAKYDRVEKQPYKFFQLYKKHKRNKYKRKIEKVGFKLSQVDDMNFVVDFDSIEVDDLKFKGGDDENKHRSKKDKYNESASKQVRKKLRFKNIFQAILFFGLQGAIFFNATSGWEVFVYFLIMVPTFFTASLVAYISTYRRMVGTWLANQRDKLKDLKKMNKETIDRGGEE